MRHPIPADLEWLDDAVDGWPCTVRWDVSGYTPSEPLLAARLWDGVATQRVTLDADGQPSGLVQLTDVNLINRTARLEVIACDPALIETSVRIFLRQAFEDFPLRIVYLHAVADALDVAALVPDAKEVGRLREHHLRGRGTYEDLAIHELRLPETLVGE
jgi:hypothetical protein